MIRRADWEAVGGLDGRFFAHMEEIDLCWRLRARGRGIVCVPQSTVYHVGGGTLAQHHPRKTFLNFRNNLFLLYKNLPKADGKRMLLVRRLYDTLSIVMFIVTFQWANARAVIRAHNHYRRSCHRYDGIQPEVNLLKTMPGTDRNIVIDYFLLGKRKF